MTNEKKDLHSFQFDQLEVEALMDILVFAGQTAAYLANKEATAGRAGEELLKLARLANDSNGFLKYMKTSVDIGEPESDVLN